MELFDQRHGCEKLECISGEKFCFQKVVRWGIGVGIGAGVDQIIFLLLSCMSSLNILNINPHRIYSLGICRGGKK